MVAAVCGQVMVRSATLPGRSCSGQEVHRSSGRILASLDGFAGLPTGFLLPGVRTVAALLQRSGGWQREQGGVGGRPTISPGCPVPFKAKLSCRHHIPRQRFKVTNWREYDASLRQRGSLTVWLTKEAIAAWQATPRTIRGG